MKTLTTPLVLFVLLTVSGTAQASLIDRGNGMLYDDVLNVTWLQDASLAASNTFGYDYGVEMTPGGRIDSLGRMSWNAIPYWIGAMNASNYLGYSDWRVPTTKPINGVAFINTYSYTHDGSTDLGNNISEQGTAYAGNTGSEMAYLFYNSLDFKGRCNPITSTSSSCVYNPGNTIYNPGPFTNLPLGPYWSGTIYNPGDQNTVAWYFDFGGGTQMIGAQNMNLNVLVLRDGDVAAVPVPASTWLLGSGLLGLVGVARRKVA